MVLVKPVSVMVLTLATSANLGPGFDSLGLALQLYNRFKVQLAHGDPQAPVIRIEGEYGEGLSAGADNLFFRSFAGSRNHDDDQHPAWLWPGQQRGGGRLRAGGGERIVRPDIIQAAVEAGAHGASLSGGGPSIIALASSNFTGILRAMQEAAKPAGVEGTGRILRADQQGARVLPVDRERRRKQPNPNYRYHPNAMH